MYIYDDKNETEDIETLSEDADTKCWSKYEVGGIYNIGESQM